MTWKVIYHHDVHDDLVNLGKANARLVLKVITDRIQNGEPDKLGKPLNGPLAGFRRIRTGDLRIVYRVDSDQIEVLVIAVGPRRNAEVYGTALARV